MSAPVKSPSSLRALRAVKSKDLRALVAQAVEHGAVASVTGSGHVKLTRPGLQPVIASSSPSDRMTVVNTRARLRRLGYFAL